MKKVSILIMILLISIMGFITGCDNKEIRSEEHRINLYVDVMKSVFQKENGGNNFIAVKLDTLEGLNSEDKQKVLEGLKNLSPNVYKFEDIKSDKTKFEFDGEESLGTKNGTVLWIEITEFKNKTAKISGTSWFGNLGSVSIQYQAKLINKNWNLTEVSTRES